VTLQDSAADYRFDEFRLDRTRGTVLGGDGSELRLRPKAFALLLHLLDNPGRLLSRDELLNVLWANVIVTDDSLTHCISELRHAFGDRSARILRTVPKRGYMLIAEVRRDNLPPREIRSETPPAAVRPHDTTALWEDPIAIYRFETPDRDAACLLLAEALITDLIAACTQIEGLRVVPEPDTLVGNGYRVRGEVRAVGSELRITLRLEDVATDAVVWAERVDQSRDGPSEFPKATLLTLASHFNRHVARHSLSAARRKPLTELTPRELVLIGRDHHQLGTEADTQVANEMFARAIEADPGYAQAYAWQAFTVQRAITHGWGGAGDQEARDESLRLARRAVQLQPESTLCLSRLAFSLVLHQRWEEAVASAHAALTLIRPAFTFTRNTCCEILTAAGHADEAVVIAQETLALDPTCPPTTQGILGRALLLAGRVEEALPQLRWCATHLPDYAPTYDSLVVAAMESGREPEALAAWREISRLRPDWMPRNHTGLWFFRRSEDLDRFQAAYQRAAELAHAADKHSKAAAGLSLLGADRGPDVIEVSAPVSEPANPQTLFDLRRDTLIVHPFQASPDDRAAAHVAAVLFSDLSAELVRYENLRVLAGPNVSAEQGCRLKGDLHSAGENVWTTLQLDDIATGVVFWAKRFERRPDSAADGQANSIKPLAAAIDMQVGRETLRRARQTPIERLNAREFAFLGKELYQRRTEGNTAAAREMFARASEIDPEYATAHAWHALTLTRGVIHGWNGIERSEAVERAVGLARRAVELEPDSPISLASLAVSLAMQEHWEEAVNAARLALHGDRSAGEGARISSCDVLASAGHPDEAEAILRETIAQIPHGSPIAHAVLGRAVLLCGRPDEAVGSLRRSAAQLPDYALCFRTLVVAAIEAGMIDDARAALREVSRLRPEWIQGTEPIFWFLRKKHDLERCETAFQMALRLDVAARTGGLLKAPASRA
jgi:DNA-binding winged helix-turn-helix (wHTH) protein/tetratricopeptide (TPR) repeat protein